MYMSLENGDVIYIHGFKEENPSFYCSQHFKDLIGLPTRVFLNMSDTIYVTHPILDVVPLYDCVDYEVLTDVDVGYHHKLKDKLQMLKQFGVKSVPIDMVKKIFKPKLKTRIIGYTDPLELGISGSKYGILVHVTKFCPFRYTLIDFIANFCKILLEKV